jgi:Right handed beta helix region
MPSGRPSLRSRGRIVVRPVELNLTRAFPTVTEVTCWESVFDGRELCIVDVANLEIQGLQSKLLAEPRYAWVLNFRNCHNIALRNLCIGHLSPGYCQGGVLRFDSCAGISIVNCELFGCGTYAVELTECERVEVLGTTMRDCTYGIMQMKNCTNVVFSDCRFAENEKFDLCQFFGKMDRVLFKNCLFEENKSDRSFFSFKGVTKPGLGVSVRESTFRDNQYKSLSDDKEGFFFSEHDNAFT